MTPPPREHERLGDEIAELSAHLDAATHRFLTLIRRFDAVGGFADQGCLTCAHWLAWRVGLDLGAAREHVRVARALGALPALDGALRPGRISYSKVRALTRVATPENDGALLAIARSSTAAQLERICRGLRRATAAAGDDAGPPVEVIVHLESGGGTLDDGTALPSATAERLACDATVVEVVEDARGNVLDVGRRRRTIPTLLRRGLRLRDRGCRFPGCTNRRVDGHHVVPWSHGGCTALENLCSLCRRHHRYVHELGFRIEPDGHGAFRFRDPAGHELPMSCRPPVLCDAPIEALRAEARAAGIAIDAETSLPCLDFRPADYGQVVSLLAIPLVETPAVTPEGAPLP